MKESPLENMDECSRRHFLLSSVLGNLDHSIFKFPKKGFSENLPKVPGRHFQGIPETRISVNQ